MLKTQSLQQIEQTLAHGAPTDRWRGPGTPLQTAIQARSPELVALLLRARADPNERGKKGVSLLHMAAFDGQTETCRSLLHARAEPNSQDCHGQTPLFFAPSRAVCVMLYKSHADLNAINQRGQSALHLAARAGLPEVILWLARHVSRGILSLRDADGVFAVDYCRRAGVRPDVADKLRPVIGDGPVSPAVDRLRAPMSPASELPASRRTRPKHVSRSAREYRAGRTPEGAPQFFSLTDGESEAASCYNGSVMEDTFGYHDWAVEQRSRAGSRAGSCSPGMRRSCSPAASRESLHPICSRESLQHMGSKESLQHSVLRDGSHQGSSGDLQGCSTSIIYQSSRESLHHSASRDSARRSQGDLARQSLVSVLGEEQCF